MDIYRQNILDHARNPQHWGLLPRPDIRGSEVNISCGDEVTIDIKLKSQSSNLKTTNKKSKLNNAITNNPITAVGFEGSGCIVMLASTDILSDYIKEKTITDIMGLPDTTIFDFFGGKLTLSRQTCALLPLLALRKGILEKSKAQSSKSKLQ